MVKTKHIILILAMLPVAVFGQVPDTDNFGLDTVVSVVGASSATLQTCFNEADAAAFDPMYEGDKDRLSNFRNYTADVCATNICKVATVTTDKVNGISGSQGHIYFGQDDGLYAYDNYENGLSFIEQARNGLVVRGIDAVDSTVAFIEGDISISEILFKSDDTWGGGLGQWAPSQSGYGTSIHIDTTDGNNYIYVADDGDGMVRRATYDFTNDQFTAFDSYSVTLNNLSGITGIGDDVNDYDSWAISVHDVDTAAGYANWAGADPIRIEGSTLADSSEIDSRYNPDNGWQQFIIANGTFLGSYNYSGGAFKGGTQGNDYLSSNARDVKWRNDTIYILMEDRIELRVPSALNETLTDYYVNTQSGNVAFYLSGRYIYVANKNGLFVYEIP